MPPVAPRPALGNPRINRTSGGMGPAPTPQRPTMTSPGGPPAGPKIAPTAPQRPIGAPPDSGWPKGPGGVPQIPGGTVAPPAPIGGGRGPTDMPGPGGIGNGPKSLGVYGDVPPPWMGGGGGFPIDSMNDPSQFRNDPVTMQLRKLNEQMTSGKLSQDDWLKQSMNLQQQFPNQAAVDKAYPQFAQGPSGWPQDPSGNPTVPGGGDVRQPTGFGVGDGGFGMPTPLNPNGGTQFPGPGGGIGMPVNPNTNTGTTFGGGGFTPGTGGMNDSGYAGGGAEGNQFGQYGGGGGTGTSVTLPPPTPTWFTPGGSQGGGGFSATGNTPGAPPPNIAPTAPTPTAPAPPTGGVGGGTASAPGAPPRRPMRSNTSAGGLGTPNPQIQANMRRQQAANRGGLGGLF